MNNVYLLISKYEEFLSEYILFYIRTRKFSLSLSCLRILSLKLSLIYSYFFRKKKIWKMILRIYSLFKSIFRNLVKFLVTWLLCSIYLLLKLKWKIIKSKKITLSLSSVLKFFLFLAILRLIVLIKSFL